jgi:hypothetical protein
MNAAMSRGETLARPRVIADDKNENSNRDSRMNKPAKPSRESVKDNPGDGTQNLRRENSRRQLRLQ